MIKPYMLKRFRKEINIALKKADTSIIRVDIFCSHFNYVESGCRNCFMHPSGSKLYNEPCLIDYSFCYKINAEYKFLVEFRNRLQLFIDNDENTNIEELRKIVKEIDDGVEGGEFSKKFIPTAKKRTSVSRRISKIR